ncbi:MAG: 50S ribosomal protein L4 [Candidatus Omnitrophica bacterium]|nr:50S ribosomal protein L4 [Candidatus Omnitrophota bacterium]
MEKKIKNAVIDKKVKAEVKGEAEAKRPLAAKGTRDISSIPVYNSSGKEIEKAALDKKLFTGEVNKAILYQATIMYHANQRRGTASTKTRSDVSGGGKKPWRQKGTGRARAGSTRSPLWRGGGIIFGPHPRDFHYHLPKKMLKVALLSGLNAKVRDEEMIAIDRMEINEPKTKKFQEILDALKIQGKSLFILEEISDNVKKASRNIDNVSVKNYKDFNVMDLMSCDKVVISKGALGKLPERLAI